MYHHSLNGPLATYDNHNALGKISCSLAIFDPLGGDRRGLSPTHIRQSAVNVLVKAQVVAAACLILMVTERTDLPRLPQLHQLGFLKENHLSLLLLGRRRLVDLLIQETSHISLAKLCIHIFVLISHSNSLFTHNWLLADGYTHFVSWTSEWHDAVKDIVHSTWTATAPCCDIGAMNCCRLDRSGRPQRIYHNIYIIHCSLTIQFPLLLICFYLALRYSKLVACSILRWITATECHILGSSQAHFDLSWYGRHTSTMSTDGWWSGQIEPFPLSIALHFLQGRVMNWIARLFIFDKWDLLTRDIDTGPLFIALALHERIARLTDTFALQQLLERQILCRVVIRLGQRCADLAERLGWTHESLLIQDVLVWRQLSVGLALINEAFVKDVVFRKSCDYGALTSVATTVLQEVADTPLHHNLTIHWRFSRFCCLLIVLLILNQLQSFLRRLCLFFGLLRRWIVAGSDSHTTANHHKVIVIFRNDRTWHWTDNFWGLLWVNGRFCSSL